MSPQAPIEGLFPSEKEDTIKQPRSRFARLSQAIAHSIYENHQGSTLDSADFIPPLAEVTKKTRERIFNAWTHYVILLQRDSETLSHIDIPRVWSDLALGSLTSVELCKSFLEAYVEGSKRVFLTLGPEEEEERYTITCPVSVDTVWKRLIAEADDRVLLPERLKARGSLDAQREAQGWKLKRGQNGVGAHDRGIVTVITDWIYGPLSERYGLRESDYQKVEFTAADIVLFLETLWIRADDIPCTPTARVSFNGLVLMLGLGGFRRNMVLGIKFRQVQMSLVRDPKKRDKIWFVTTITVFKNKLSRASRKKGRANTQLQFSLLLVPRGHLCLASLILARALQQDAFKEHFSSVSEVLNRPVLEDIDFLRLDLKDSVLDQPLFPMTDSQFSTLWHRTLLVLGCKQSPRTYALRIGTLTRLDGYLKPALRNYIASQTTRVFETSYQTEHIRVDLTELTFGPDDKERGDDAVFERMRDCLLERDPVTGIKPSECPPVLPRDSFSSSSSSSCITPACSTCLP